MPELLYKVIRKGWGDDKYYAVQSVEVLRRTEKQVRLRRCEATGFGESFTLRDFKALRLAETPDAAVAAWRQSLREEAARLREEAFALQAAADGFDPLVEDGD